MLLIWQGAGCAPLFKIFLGVALKDLEWGACLKYCGVMLIRGVDPLKKYPLMMEINQL